MLDRFVRFTRTRGPPLRRWTAPAPLATIQAMSTAWTALAAAIADRYRVEREVARGGMAAVFLATDLRHQRRVAIKVLDPGIAGLVSVDRFLNEIRVMAGLQHPHILPLFDSGNAAGLPYYVMPFVDGETLKERIARERRLGVDDARRIAGEVASALDFAHRHGVVHRDIKPANILLSDGHVLVADFGIARALSLTAAGGGLTGTGVAIGTPGYMSPEQASGDAAIDGRTDIYALGAVVHEMLAGEPPFTGPSPQAIIARTLTQRPAPLTELRPGIDAGMSAAVQRALATERSDRFAVADHFVAALGAPTGAREGAPPAARAGTTRRSAPVGVRVGGALAAAAVIAAVVWFATRGAAPRTGGPVVRVAVLPFRESGDTAHPDFASGLATALRSDLATLPSVDVIAGTSLDALGDSVRIPRYVAQQLGATHVLSGTVQWERSGAGALRVRVVPELVDVRSGVESSTRGDPVDEPVGELFRLEARVSSAIAQSLGVPLSADAVTRLARPPTTNRAAYEAYLKSRVDNSERTAYLEQAVALDSTFAQALGELAEDAVFAYRGGPTAPGADRARGLVERALALDSSSLAVRMGALAYERHVHRDFDAAARHADAAMRLAPGNAEVMHLAAAALFSARRFDDAHAIAARAAALDPRNASALARLQNLQLWMHDIPAARITAGRAIAAAGRRIGFINIDSVWLPLMAGDTAGVHAFVRSLPDDAARGQLVAIADRDWLQGWAFDAAATRAGLVQLRKAGDDLLFHTARARSAWLAGGATLAARYADSAVAEGRARLRELPQEERIRITLAYAMALGGRCPEALAQSDTAHRTRSAWQDGFFGAGISLTRAEVLAVCGRSNEAIALVDSLSREPGFVTPGWLQVDPHFTGLRSHPAFARLAGLAPPRR